MSADGKLVRDRIPEIIRASGAEPVTYQADPAEYRRRLREKLLEEVDKFLEADDSSAVEELADILEVVHALAADLGTSKDALETIRAAKAGERGAFADRTIWTGVR
ncbi:putative house-cleaning noncanonical NTP pyrophosphatase (MazG superfamily) [Kribbella sp. VKM Ac-2569]|uniref:nucleoside triphosphate pyrophosphohydrolase n=1 Tax=Kribbella sp. VKM Ac-2569 TaxID=2512220 RepID=UPI0010E5A5B0|nr:nucleoside triphosphate pyrophosphohydrolase [Kribbella sp. VKM Ac-2569]RZT20050.1 putative house-cleaning noncanonical NTP pyrophosphatase (MazG superfamily) [Kribbella sp. VKM Ac-2569]